MKNATTKIDKKYGVSKGDADRGFTNAEVETEEDVLKELFDKPPGGFLGRSKGWER